MISDKSIETAVIGIGAAAVFGLAAVKYIDSINEEKNAFRDVVILNTASALVATGNSNNLEEAALMSIKSIDEGKDNMTCILV